MYIIHKKPFRCIYFFALLVVLLQLPSLPPPPLSDYAPEKDEADFKASPTCVNFERQVSVILNASTLNPELETIESPSLRLEDFPRWILQIFGVAINIFLFRFWSYQHNLLNFNLSTEKSANLIIK